MLGQQYTLDYRLLTASKLANSSAVVPAVGMCLQLVLVQCIEAVYRYMLDDFTPPWSQMSPCHKYLSVN